MNTLDRSELITALRVLKAYTEYIEPTEADIVLLRQAEQDFQTPIDELACEIIHRENLKPTPAGSKLKSGLVLP